MKRWLLVRKTRKKQSQESRLFFEGRNISKFIFNFAQLFGKNMCFFLHACRKVYLTKGFNIQFIKVNSRVKKFSCEGLKGYSDISELNNLLPTYCKLMKENFQNF